MAGPDTPSSSDRPTRLLRAFDGLDSWRLTNVGVMARRVVEVGATKWTVCYMVHVIPSRRVEYKASITLWPRTGKRLTSRRQLGWHPELREAKWYQACGRALARHGYRGSWQWSPWGRFGDFWKTLKNLDALAREIRLLERLRRAPLLGPSQLVSG
jgi:hypothetical protein